MPAVPESEYGKKGEADKSGKPGCPGAGERQATQLSKEAWNENIPIEFAEILAKDKSTMVRTIANRKLSKLK